MTTLVTGARGQIGHAVLRGLHAGGHPVRAASRHPGRLDVPGDIETTALDLADPDTFGPALKGVTRIFLYAEPERVEEFLDSAERAGVGHVVLLSSSAVTEEAVTREVVAEEAATEGNWLTQRHLVVERALTTSALDATVLRPGAFASNALNWAHAIRAGEPVRLAYPDAQTAPIHGDDLADVAVAALTGDALTNRVLPLGGPESLTFREQIEIIGARLGRDIPIRELRRVEAEEEMGRFLPAPALASLLDFWAAAVGTPARVDETAERVTGRPARTFADWVDDRLAAFTASR